MSGSVVAMISCSLVFAVICISLSCCEEERLSGVFPSIPESLDNQQINCLRTDVQNPDTCNFDKSLGRGFYLPSSDLESVLTQGASIFKQLPGYCFNSEDLKISRRETVFFKDTTALMASMSKEHNLEASLRTPFTLGVSVDSTTQHISGSSRLVKGLTLNIFSHTRQENILRDCFHMIDVDEDLDSSFIADFKKLEAKIEKPWLGVSWSRYEAFMKKYGTHLVSQVTYGVSLRQDTFSESVHDYSARDFSIKACMDFAGDARLNEFEISTCSGITDKERNKSTSLVMSRRTLIKGGTDSTRSKILQERSPELVQQILSEAREHSSPMAYEFYAIYNLLKVRYSFSEYITQALNLESYFKGYLNFECPYLQTSNGFVIQEFILDQFWSTPVYPQYSCSVIAEGCNTDDDCHFNRGYWCNCAGPSCVRYEKKQGSSKEVGVVYEDSDWLGPGCKLDPGRLWHGCYCDQGRDLSRKMVWKSETIRHLAMNMDAYPETFLV